MEASLREISYILNVTFGSAEHPKQTKIKKLNFLGVADTKTWSTNISNDLVLKTMG